MTVGELTNILNKLDEDLNVVRTNENGQHEEITHVDVEIGCGVGLTWLVVVEGTC